ncbi:MAG: hypothetical protein ACFFBD_04620 [Candidatus Hodarchaeota archaeon]
MSEVDQLVSEAESLMNARRDLEAGILFEKAGQIALNKYEDPEKAARAFLQMLVTLYGAQQYRDLIAKGHNAAISLKRHLAYTKAAQVAMVTANRALELGFYNEATRIFELVAGIFSRKLEETLQIACLLRAAEAQFLSENYADGDHLLVSAILRSGKIEMEIDSPDAWERRGRMAVFFERGITYIENKLQGTIIGDIDPLPDSIRGRLKWLAAESRLIQMFSAEERSPQEIKTVARACREHFLASAEAFLRYTKAKNLNFATLAYNGFAFSWLISKKLEKLNVQKTKISEDVWKNALDFAASFKIQKNAKILQCLLEADYDQFSDIIHRTVLQNLEYWKENILDLLEDIK